MRVLFLFTHAGYLRNFERPVRLLAERGHVIHVGVDRETKSNLPGHADLLNVLVAELPNVSTDTAPGSEPTDRRLASLGALAWRDYLRFLEPEFSGALKLRRRAGAKLPSVLRWASDTLLTRRAGREAVRRVLKSLYDGLPIDARVRQYIEHHDPDVIVVSPLVDLVSAQAEYVRCAKAMGIPTCMPVASWDNLTTKGLIHEVPDVVTVWNESQRAEAVQLHGVPPERTVVTGAVAHDHWFDWAPSRHRKEFCERIGIDPCAPFVLYAGSSPFVGVDEGSFISTWISDVRTAHGGVLADLQIVVRPHPQSPLSGERLAELERLQRVVVHPSTGRSPTDLESRNEYFDSLYHSAAVIGLNTSAFLEGAIVGRPVHALLTPQYSDAQKGTLHFHLLLPENGGILKTAATIDEHVDQLRASIDIDGDAADENREFVERFLRPVGGAEPASSRLVEVIESLIDRRPEASATERARPAGRALAYVALAAIKVKRPRWPRE